MPDFDRFFAHKFQTKVKDIQVNNRERRRLLKKKLFKVISILFVVISTLTAATAILIKSHANSIDLVQNIKQLQTKNRRDDALVLVQTFNDITDIQNNELAKLRDQLEYSSAEKFKSVLWNGMMKGEVYDHYSGLGAVSSEMCMWSDIRDLAIKGYSFMDNHFGNPNPIIHPGMVSLAFCYPIIDGPAVLSKATVKYLDRLPKPPNTGLVRQFVSGDLEPINEEKIWQLFKKTPGQLPEPHPLSSAFPIRNISTLQSIL
jgi:hypothetical protein